MRTMTTINISESDVIDASPDLQAALQALTDSNNNLDADVQNLTSAVQSLTAVFVAQQPAATTDEDTEVVTDTTGDDTTGDDETGDDETGDDEGSDS